ncbi:LPS export ABC transporter ATP-binding protein [Longimicrobium terrae]|uniref:LPS export ABC transporter ATP-binding protein n=1 Tax=Longimicrobium terrae TaxID=1639882 RepID=A0A841H4U9_9BACT|nr:LPS export ABC transporter ATP-binding protein [Longimicrobium terrae]MBB6072916.1 LPS export ABC transporter ATP-binding protein [Longimicrobium terrae]
MTGFDRLVQDTGAADLSTLIAVRALVDHVNDGGMIERAAWLTGVHEEYRRWYAGQPGGAGHPENFPASETMRYLDEHIVRALVERGILEPPPPGDDTPELDADSVRWAAVRLTPRAAGEVADDQAGVLARLDARIGQILSPASSSQSTMTAASTGTPSTAFLPTGTTAAAAMSGSIPSSNDAAPDTSPIAPSWPVADADQPVAATMDAQPERAAAAEPTFSREPMLVPGGATLTATGLVKVYRKRRVVNEVDLHVAQGEIVGLLGPNGAGKTTSFYMMVGLIRPDKGKVFVGQRELTRVPMYKRARAGIGYLAQEPSIFRKLTVEDNVMAILQTMKIPRAERKKRLEQLLDELSIKHVRKSRAYALSGGERRRLEITRALVGNPKFMLLDEPFAGVDPIAVHDIQQIVSDLRRRGIGVLISDHNVEQTLDIVDRAYIMYDGRVRVSGTVSELVWNEEVSELYLGPTLAARMRERYPNPALSRAPEPLPVQLDAAWDDGGDPVDDGPAVPEMDGMPGVRPQTAHPGLDEEYATGPAARDAARETDAGVPAGAAAAAHDDHGPHSAAPHDGPDPQTAGPRSAHDERWPGNSQGGTRNPQQDEAV